MLRVLLLLFVAHSVFVAPVAHAGNDDGYFHDNQAALAGGAVVGGGSGAGMLWYNPAGLGANHRGRIEVTASAFSLRFRNADDFLVVGGDSADLSAINFQTVPTALSMVRKLGRGWFGGIGSYTTRQDTLDEELVVENASGDVATYRIASNVVQNNFGLGFGRAAGRFRFGASLFLVLDNQSLVESVSFIRESPDLDDVAIGLLDENQAKLNRLGLELVLGAQWQPIEAFAIGLTVRGPRFRLKDDITVNDTSIDAVGGMAAETDASRGRATSDGGGTVLSYPVRVVLGLQFRAGNVGLSIDADYSSFLSASLTTWEPQFNVRVGLTVDLGEDMVFGVGAFTDRFRGRELAPNISGDFYGASIGLTKRKRLAIREEGDIVFTTTLGARYAGSVNARLRGGRLDISGVDVDGTVFFEARLRDVRIHEVALYLGSGLDF